MHCVCSISLLYSWMKSVSHCRIIIIWNCFLFMRIYSCRIINAIILGSNLIYRKFQLYFTVGQFMVPWPSFLCVSPKSETKSRMEHVVLHDCNVYNLCVAFIDLYKLNNPESISFSTHLFITTFFMYVCLCLCQCLSLDFTWARLNNIPRTELFILTKSHTPSKIFSIQLTNFFCNSPILY